MEKENEKNDYPNQNDLVRGKSILQMPKEKVLN